jgi:hypothetical protein
MGFKGAKQKGLDQFNSFAPVLLDINTNPKKIPSSVFVLLAKTA